MGVWYVCGMCVGWAGGRAEKAPPSSEPHVQLVP